MAKTKAQLRTENSNNFPNNNSQFITPEKLRGFNNDIIDAVALEQNTNLTGTGSFSNLSGSGYVSASEFIGDGSKLTGVTSTVPAGTVSGSSQIILTDTTGNLGGNRITGSVPNATNAVSASYAVTASFALNVTPIDTGSFFISASSDFSEITFNKGDGSTLVTDVTPRKVIETVKNKNGFMAKGTPVYVSGSTGNALHVYAASASRADRMPATFVLDQDLNADEEGYGVLSGFINGVNTNSFNEGDNVYVGANGGYTNQRPSGSNLLVQKLGNVVKKAVNGSGVISGAGRSNDVPNIQQGYIWVGNADGVAKPFSTGSFIKESETGSFAKTNVNNTFTGTQNFDNISVSGTGSFGYIESVTGSAKIIGDAFIILNNDTPTERYAGIKVQDSGSTNATSSLLWDGGTNDWKYEYSASATHEAAVLLTGPEMADVSGAVYLSNNTIPKGSGTHHLNDSNLTENGGTMNLGSGGSPLQFANSILNTSRDISAGNMYAAFQILDHGAGAPDIQIETTTYSGIDGSNPVFRLRAGGTGQDGNTILAAKDDGTVNFYKNSTWVSGTSLIISGGLDVASGASTVFNGAVTASGLNLTGPLTSNSTITTSDVISSTNANGITIGSSGSPVQFGNFQVQGSNGISPGNMYISYQLVDAAGNNANSEITTYSGLDGSNAVYRLVAGGNSGQNGQTILAAFNDSTVGFYKDSTWVSGTNLIVSGTLSGQGDINLNGPTVINGSTTINNSVTVNSDISSSTYISASAFSGDGSGLSGVAKLTSNTFSGTQTLSGSIQTEVAIQGITTNTASIDFSDTSLFELTLAASNDTHIDATNIGKGQTINLLITQPSPNTGSLSFSSKFLQPTGSEYTASAVAGAQDILTLMTFNDTTKIYVAAVNQLS